MKKAFFEYVGTEDSLAKYQKSNRLVLLNTLFSLIDKTGKTLVSDVVDSYKYYYLVRKRKGLICDIGADVIINNIENATSSEVFAVIKRHPYRVLNEKNYLFIQVINDNDYFVFNQKLMSELTEDDIARLKEIIIKKLDLYFSKIDNVNIDGNSSELIPKAYIEENTTLNNENIPEVLFDNPITSSDHVGCNNQLIEIYNKFIIYSQHEEKYISLDDNTLRFTEKELQLVKENEDLFYLCSSKRVVLVKSVFDTIDKLYNSGNEVLSINEIYEYLRNEFSIKSFNKKRLINILENKDRIEYTLFMKIKRMKEDIINSLLNLNKGIQFNIQNWEEERRFPITTAFRRRIEYSLGIAEESIENEIGLTNNNYSNLQNFNTAINEVGQEFCRMSYLYPEKVLKILQSLDDYSSYITIQKERIEVLKDLVKSISSSNIHAKVCPLIKAYTNDTGIQDVLFGCTNKYSDLSQLSYMNDVSLLNNKEYSELVSFLKWLQNDFKIQLNNILQKMFKNGRQYEIIKERAAGLSLEEVGKKIGVSRQGISQIECKFEKPFINFITRYRPEYVMLAFSESDMYITENDLHNFFTKNTFVFSYFVNKWNIRDITWKDEIQSYIVGDCKWFEDMTNEIGNLPEFIPICDVKQVISAIKDRVSITEDVIETIMFSIYRQHGEYISKNKITKKDMYKIIVEKHYPDGIKLFDDFEMMRFKSYLRESFGEVNLGIDDTRAISSRITDFTVLYDRGKYILPTAIQIEQQLLEDIYDFILNHERPNIMFVEIFEKFKLRLLEESNIHNRYFLQGTLKYFWNDKFSFYRDTISRESGEERNIRKHIEDFVKSSPKPITVKDIKDNFIGVTDIVINMALSDNGDILQWGFGEYIHSSTINIDNEETEKLKQALVTELEFGTISTRALYDHIFERDQSLLNDNKIYNHIALFSIYQYLFTDEFSYSRPYISNGDTGMTTESVIEEYIANYDELSITDFKLYLDNKHIKIMNFSTLLDKNCSDFLRVNEDLLIRTSRLAITESIINDVQDSIISILGEKGYIAAKDYNDFFFFPYIGVRWTSHLLVSFIKKYCGRLSVSKYTIDHRYLTEIIFRCDLDIKSHYDLICYALRYENGKAQFNNTDEIERFLKKENLIASTSTIPKILLTNNIIEIICGIIKIN